MFLLVFMVLSGARRRERTQHEVALLYGEVPLIFSSFEPDYPDEKGENMYWNNGIETRRFAKRMKQQEILYRQLGMTETQIQAVQAYDLQAFLSERKYKEHTRPLESYPDDMNCDSMRLLYRKNMDRFTTQMGHAYDNPFWWIDDLEDDRLLLAILQLSEYQKMLLTLIVIEGFTQQEAGECLGLTQSAVSRQMQRIRRLLNRRK